MRRSLKPRIFQEAGRLRISLPGADPLAFWGAAYHIREKAHAVVESAGRELGVTLWARGARRLPASLAQEFLAVYDDQRWRWSLERKNLDVRAEVLRRALALIKGDGADRADRTPALSEEQKAEIARMLREAEQAPTDPLGIAAPWDERRSA